MKLNLGCGHWKLPGYLNVDSQPACEPDQLVDLEALPWPFPDDSCDEVLLSHVLEHLGEERATYLGILKELYRICRPGALVQVIVPHPRHDLFLIDPTHVRAILPESLGMLSKRKNLEWKRDGIADTPLGLYLNVDFETTEVTYLLDPFWEAQITTGKMTRDGVLAISRSYANVIQETTIRLRVIKP